MKTEFTREINGKSITLKFPENWNTKHELLTDTIVANQFVDQLFKNIEEENTNEQPIYVQRITHIANRFFNILLTQGDLIFTIPIHHLDLQLKNVIAMNPEAPNQYKVSKGGIHVLTVEFKEGVFDDFLKEEKTSDPAVETIRKNFCNKICERIASKHPSKIVDEKPVAYKVRTITPFTLVVVDCGEKTTIYHFKNPFKVNTSQAGLFKSSQAQPEKNIFTQLLKYIP